MIVYYCRTCRNKNKRCELCRWVDTAFPTMFAEVMRKVEVAAVLGVI